MKCADLRSANICTCALIKALTLRPNAQNHTNAHTLHHLNGPVTSHKPGSSSNNCHSMGIEF